MVKKVLAHLGLPTERPEPQRARPRLQLVLPLATAEEGAQAAPSCDQADPPWRDDQVSEAYARYGLAA